MTLCLSLPKEHCWYQGLLSLAGWWIPATGTRLEKLCVQCPSCESINARETSMTSAWLLHLEVKHLLTSVFLIIWPVGIQKQQVRSCNYIGPAAPCLRDSALSHNSWNYPERPCLLTFTVWPCWWIYSMHSQTSDELLCSFSITRDRLLRTMAPTRCTHTGGTDDSAKCFGWKISLQT